MTLRLAKTQSPPDSRTMLLRGLAFFTLDRSLPDHVIGHEFVRGPLGDAMETAVAGNRITNSRQAHNAIVEALAFPDEGVLSVIRDIPHGREIVNHVVASNSALLRRVADGGSTDVKTCMMFGADESVVKAISEAFQQTPTAGGRGPVSITLV